MLPNWFFDNLKLFLVYPFIDQVPNKNFLWPKWKNLGPGVTTTFLATNTYFDFLHIYMVINLICITVPERVEWRVVLVGTNQRLAAQRFSVNYPLMSSSNYSTYSHLSNKCGAHAYRFLKIPPSTKQKSTLHVYWFLRFFHPPLLVY